ncbi:hypothetical protein TanjilG_13680 [Lupinus angustifolius]|uniref:DUF789 family protein n=1 Tax=Lupinus angustifolius TaxID=3871 RepID=A0A1J7GW86_LUPAN|nr:PREDICTED: uncharacterized protein LOC109357157 [Lupinus angustifolius]OIW04832.1 hypothetical protein TanjilG_13680 [Lupinus angustifolius]
MLGTGLNLGRICGDDRLKNPVQVRWSMQRMENDKLCRAHSDVTEKELENRVESGEPVQVQVPSCEPEKRLSNLERFLRSITPSVTAQYLSKTTMRGFPTCNVEFQPYFVLGDLWESFREWSAYGAGVPLVVNDNDSVVQYYVPYLSAIQIYGAPVKPSLKSRQVGEDSDNHFRDSSSDGSSDSEEISHSVGRLSLNNHNSAPQDGFSSDEGESVNSKGCLLFEYLEHDLPFSREPLADKILDLTFRFPELMTLRSCDIQPSSWISVAWYPIYRIPTGPTLKDLDACFLTYHSLYTPVGGSQGVQDPAVSYPIEVDGVPKMPLPVFGLATYKFKGSLWGPNGTYERQLTSTLMQAADEWLSLLHVRHPDFTFFSRR